jgi:voltage-gated potassium channel
VGYGDVSPETPLGQAVAALVMVMGYGVIAVPTGIVSAEMAVAATGRRQARQCSSCLKPGHGEGAKFCSACGAELDKQAP